MPTNFIGVIKSQLQKLKYSEKITGIIIKITVPTSAGNKSILPAFLSSHIFLIKFFTRLIIADKVYDILIFYKNAEKLS